MAKEKKNNKKIQDEEPDLSPGFFSSYGLGEGCFVIHEPGTGRKFRYKNGKKVYEK